MWMSKLISDQVLREIALAEEASGNAQSVELDRIFEELSKDQVAWLVEDLRLNPNNYSKIFRDHFSLFVFW